MGWALFKHAFKKTSETVIALQFLVMNLDRRLRLLFWHFTHISHPLSENREAFFVPMSNESLTHKESEGVFLS